MVGASTLRPRAFLIPFLVVLFLILPYLILGLNLREARVNQFDWAEFQWAFRNSLLQSLLSASLSCVVGFFLSLGLNELKQRIQKPSVIGLLEWALLMPSFLPPLFVILVGFKVIEPFPFGILGVSLVHALMYSGLIAVNLSEIICRRLPGMAHIAWMYGCSRWRFLPLSFSVLRSEWLGQFFLVAVASFASFSVPLVMGGGSGTTLEVLIYEKIMITSDVSAAVWISALQTLFLILCSYRISSLNLDARVRNERALPLRSPIMRSRSGALLVVLWILLLLWPLVSGLFEGWSELREMPQIVEVVSAAIFPSILSSLVGGILFVFCLFVLVSPLVGSNLRRFVRGWVAPSTALVGLAILLIDSPEGLQAWANYIIGFVMISVGSLYRWGLDEEMRRVESMSWIAKSYGASSWIEFRWIQLPYFWKSIWSFSGIGAIWLMGDFALAKMVIGGQETLPLVIEALMGSYRLEAGMSLAGVLFAASAGVWLLFKGVGRVLD